MNKWNDYYKIVEVTPEGNHNDGAVDWMLGLTSNYEIHDPDGKVIGTYRDYRYAKKQAKYKFKKLISKMEKILLG